jgi:hypothetical protein
MASGDDAFGADGKNDAGADEFAHHCDAIQELVGRYFDEHEIPESAVSVLMLNVAIAMRMIGYAIETEKPSASGLKLDLDRYRREIDDAIRHAKKGADEFIENIKSVLARTQAEDAAEDGEQ